MPKPDPIDKNKCGVCRQEKPVNEYCTNDCQYLLKGKPEDVIPAIFGAYRGGRYLPACVSQIEYLFQSATEKAEERSDGCPCLLVEPCSYACSCATPTMSGGCMRCCKYGSLEQRKESAKQLAKIIERGLKSKKEECDCSWRVCPKHVEEAKKRK